MKSSSSAAWPAEPLRPRVCGASIGKAGMVLVERGPYISFANCGLPYHISGAIAERGEPPFTSKSLFEARYRVDVRSSVSPRERRTPPRRGPAPQASTRRRRKQPL